MSRQNDHIVVLAEELKLQRIQILEALQALAELPAKVDNLSAKVIKLTQDMTEVKADIKVIKRVVTQHSVQLHSHERRITALEHASG